MVVVVVWGSLLRHRGGSHGPLEVSGSLWDPVRPPAMEEGEGRGEEPALLVEVGRIVCFAPAQGTNKTNKPKKL